MFRVVWISHPKVLEFEFYTLKLDSVSNSLPTISFYY